MAGRHHLRWCSPSALTGRTAPQVVCPSQARAPRSDPAPPQGGPPVKSAPHRRPSSHTHRHRSVRSSARLSPARRVRQRPRNRTCSSQTRPRRETGGVEMTASITVGDLIHEPSRRCAMRLPTYTYGFGDMRRVCTGAPSLRLSFPPLLGARSHRVIPQQRPTRLAARTFSFRSTGIPIGLHSS